MKLLCCENKSLFCSAQEFRYTRQTAFFCSNTAFQRSKYIGKHHNLCSKIFLFYQILLSFFGHLLLSPQWTLAYNFSMYAVCLSGGVGQSTAIQDVSPAIRRFETVRMTYVLPVPTDILFCFTAAFPDFMSLPLTIVFVVWVYC